MQNNSIYIVVVNGLTHKVILKIVNIGVYKEGPSNFVIPSWKGAGWDITDGTQYFLGGTKDMAIEWMSEIQAKLKI